MAISLSCLAVVPVVTAVVVLPVLLKYIQKALSRPVVLKYRRVMHLPNARFRDFSVGKRLVS